MRIIDPPVESAGGIEAEEEGGSISREGVGERGARVGREWEWARARVR